MTRSINVLLGKLSRFHSRCHAIQLIKAGYKMAVKHCRHPETEKVESLQFWMAMKFKESLELLTSPTNTDGQCVVDLTDFKPQCLTLDE